MHSTGTDARRPTRGLLLGRARRLGLCLVLAACSGCGDDSPDADSGALDARPSLDGGPRDSASPDASTSDAGVDSALPDSSTRDGGGRPLHECALESGTGTFELSSTERPDYLRPYRDPVYGTDIIRVSGDPGTAVGGLGESWGDLSRHGYSKRQPWNADQSLLMIDAADRTLLLDGSTYAPLRFLNAPVSMNEARWHPSDPATRIYASDDEIGAWNVETGDTRRIAAPAGYSAFHFGPWEGNLRRDGTEAAVLAEGPSGTVAFLVNLDTGEKGPDISLAGIDVDWVSVSPLGTYVVVNGWNDKTQVYGREGSPIGGRWTEYGRPSHYDLTVDSAGDEVAVGVSKSAPDDGRVISRRLSDGQVRELTVGGYATHTSTRNHGLPGWAFVTYNYRDDVWLPYRDEVLAVPLDPAHEPLRLGHLHRVDAGYESESQAVPSPDGLRVLFASNWDDASGPIGAYVIDLRPACP